MGSDPPAIERFHGVAGSGCIIREGGRGRWRAGRGRAPKQVGQGERLARALIDITSTTKNIQRFRSLRFAPRRHERDKSSAALISLARKAVRSETSEESGGALVRSSAHYEGATRDGLGPLRHEHAGPVRPSLSSRSGAARAEGTSASTPPGLWTIRRRHPTTRHPTTRAARARTCKLRVALLRVPPSAQLSGSAACLPCGP